MSKATSRFDLLNNVPARAKSKADAADEPRGVGEAEVHAPIPPAAGTKSKAGAKVKTLGKKSDPGYTQFSAFVPTELYRRVKSRCFLSGEELSAFVERALALLEKTEPGPKQ